jgi:hypothetical protein
MYHIPKVFPKVLVKYAAGPVKMELSKRRKNEMISRGEQKLKTIKIAWDFTPPDGKIVMRSYREVIEAIAEGVDVIHTHCLEFFNINTLKDCGYNVIIIKYFDEGSGIISLRRLLDSPNPHSAESISPNDDIRAMLIAKKFKWIPCRLNF